jgi:phage shock protein C
MNHTNPKTLTRSTSDRMLGGVAGGLANYFGIDPALTRVGFIVATLLTGGCGIVAYLAMLVVVPNDDADRTQSAPESPLPV